MFKQYRGLRRELYILFIGRIMTNMGSMIWPMMTLILNKKLGLEAGEIAKYLLILSLISLPVSLFGGKLTDKFNKKNLIVVCDLVSVLCYVYCGFVSIDASAIYLLALASLFQTVEWPAYDALVADFTLPKDRERAYSLSYLGANLGLILSPTLGGILINNYLNLAFLINGFSILFSTILIFFFIKNVNREESEDDVNEYEKDLEEGVSTLSFLKGSRVLILFIVMSCIHNLVYNQYNYLMPLDMERAYGDLGSVLFGTLSSTNCITVVLFTSIVTSLFAKYKEMSKMMLGSILQILGYVVFVFCLNNKILIYVSMFIFTIGEIFTTIASTPFESKRIPANHRGRVSSILNVACSLFTSLTNLLVGKSYDQSPMFAWSIIFVLGIIEIIMFLLLKKWDQKDYKDLY